MEVVEKVNILRRVGKNFGLLLVGEQMLITEVIAPLKGVERVSVTSTKGKLEVLQKYWVGLV